MSTRAKILDAAAEEFAEHGFAGARVASIAERSGTNIERLYFYFGDKRRLFAAVMAETMREISAAEPFTEHDLGHYVAAMTAFHHGDPRRIKLLLAEGTTGEEIVDRAQRRRHYAARVAAIRAAQAEGAIRDDIDPRIIAYLVLALVVTSEALPQVSRLILGGREPVTGKRFERELERLVQALLDPRANSTSNPTASRPRM